jgi:hypothetical protein
MVEVTAGGVIVKVGQEDLSIVAWGGWNRSLTWENGYARYERDEETTWNQPKRLTYYSRHTKTIAAQLIYRISFFN